MTIKIDLPAGDLERFSLPEGVNRRLHGLLEKQDRGEPLSQDEAAEAEGLVELAETLSVLKLRVAAAVQ